MIYLGTWGPWFPLEWSNPSLMALFHQPPLPPSTLRIVANSVRFSNSLCHTLALLGEPIDLAPFIKKTMSIGKNSLQCEANMRFVLLYVYSHTIEK